MSKVERFEDFDSPQKGAGPSLIVVHPSVITLRWRVRGRWLLGRLRLGLLWALAGAALLAVGYRAFGYPDWPTAAILWTGLALAAALAIGLRRWPNDWAVAVAADSLGLAERVSSALYADRINHPAARLIAGDADKALARLDAAGYPLLSTDRVRWRELAAVLALALAILLPLPVVGDAGRRAAEAKSIGVARETVTSLEARLQATPEYLTQAGAAELRTSEQRLAEARTAEEAARILEETQELLAGQAKEEDYAWQRSMEGLSAVWQGNPDLGALSRAIRAGDQAALERAMADLARSVAATEPAGQQSIKQALQAGANATRDIPDLAGALREAAGQLGQTGASAQGRPGAGDALAAVASLLSTGISRSAGMEALRQTMAGVGQARAGLGAVASSAVASGASPGGPASGGSPSAQAGGRSGLPAGSALGSDSRSGSGYGAGPVPGSGGGSGSGSGAGSGNGSGSGGIGTAGSGAGAGAGGDASPGQQRNVGGGATLVGGSAAPSLRGTSNYDSVYVPSLMGGDGGPQLEAPGEARGASGETVVLPNSPLELGAVRPYSEAYGRYEAAARQSLSRQPLPPSLQGLVQRYFSSIAPE